MAEFTGERVVPGQVDQDLWNEHLSRYLFASRLCRQKTVLDIGCGTGYGTAELAGQATSLIAIDQSSVAIDHAKTHYNRPNTTYLQADATVLPFAAASFELVVAFEIIEHLERWESFLDEASRVLTPGGQFVVSTPNKAAYAEARRFAGPNPFHQHEFEFEEFQAVLGARFAHVSVFLQNHRPSITFQPVVPGHAAHVRDDSLDPEPEASSFFIAVCAAAPQTGSPTFVHIPSAASVLLERYQHIQLLEEELNKKNTWLENLKEEHSELVERFRSLKEDLEERNRWADQLNTELGDARGDIDRLNQELANRAQQYEALISRLEKERDKHSRWAQSTQKTLDEKIQELAHCVEKLHETEKTVEERTAWAKSLDAEIETLRERLSRMEASRWLRIGRTFGLGPNVRQS